DKPLYLRNMQGGEFAPRGGLLYLSSGIIDCFGNDGQQPLDGLHVVDTSTWHEVQRSTNLDRQGPPRGCFDYTFDNDGCGGQEPEGLTIWDREHGMVAPNVSGELHVLLYDHNTLPFDSNTVDLKHYASFKCPADIAVE